RVEVPMDIDRALPGPFLSPAGSATLMRAPAGATTINVTECTRCRRQYQDGVRFCPVDGFAAVPVSDPYVGRLLMGQFQLVAACGRGATGTVYRAQQVAMDRMVAVKIL